MDSRFALLICSAVMLALGSVPAAAQQKTVKQCNEEWTANKASIQASGRTKKAFVAECRGQATGATTMPAQAPKQARTAAPPAAPGVKTAKECNAAWTANKAAIQASKKTKKEFMADCRAQPAGTTTATPAPTTPPPATARPAPSTSTAPSISPPERAPAPRAPARQPSTAAAPTGAGQFSSEAQAKARCPGDTVVWVNNDSHIYHFAGTRNYGTTKNGAYVCEGDAMAAGDRASKKEKHP
jgi:hypothetical protein